MSAIDPKQIYKDDCLHIGAQCGCFMRVSAMGKNEASGDRLILSWGACKKHDTNDPGFIFNVRHGLIGINDIHVIPGEITKDPKVS